MHSYSRGSGILDFLNQAVSALEKGIDLRRHINQTEQQHPGASGEFTQLLGQISLAAKVVSRAVNRAGLVDVLGTVDETNVHGEEQAQLDVYANRVFKNALIQNGGISLLASEEEEEPVTVDEPDKQGKYIVTLDPLDGSSNIDYNISIGTIFGIYNRETLDSSPGVSERGLLLQPGRQLSAAGYVLYGSSTMLVYSTGSGIYGFTLDTSIGEFLLCQPDIQMPQDGGAYSVNESYYDRWEPSVQRSVDQFKGDPNYTARYIGSLVADFHRNLLNGGIFLYPPEPDTPGKENGKLRLLYEAAPLAFLAEEAGGRASDGERDILDISPDSIHQRVPLYIGNAAAVDRIERNQQRTPSPV